MRKLSLLLFCISLLTITNLNILAQTGELSGIKLNLAAGEVVEINKEANKVTVKTKDGNIDAVIASTTVFKRVPPSDKIELKNAVDSNLSEVSVGDKILVTGMVSDDKKSIPVSKTFYLLSKSDLAKRDAAEKEMWRTKGVFGKVDSVDLRTKQIVLNVSSMTGQQKVTITPKNNVSYLRYTEESVKYADAKASSFAEIKVGDQVRALGDKSEDGLKLQAEEVVSGAFRTVIGAITAIDTAKNEVTIKDLQTNKLVTVVVTANSQLKAFPKAIASMMAGSMGGQGAAQGGGMQPPQGGQGGGNVMVRQPQGNGQGGQGEGQRGQGGQGQGGMRRMGGGGANLNDMYENLPKTTVAELKVGDQIGVSSTASINTDRLTAIKLLAGVEPFITMQQMANAANSARNGQSAPSINIPGLDGGFGAP